MAPTATVATMVISLWCTASKMVLYDPNNTKIKAPDIPGKIIAHTANAPDKNKKGKLSVFSVGGSVVI